MLKYLSSVYIPSYLGNLIKIYLDQNIFMYSRITNQIQSAVNVGFNYSYRYKRLYT